MRGNLGIAKKGISFWNFFPNSELRKGNFYHGTSTVATCCQLSSTMVRPVYYTERPPLSKEDVHETARRAVHLRQLILVSVTFPCSRLSGPSVRPSFLRIVTLLQALKITRVQVVRDRKQATTSEQAAL